MMPFTLWGFYAPEKFYTSVPSPSALCALVSFAHKAFMKQP